MTEVVVEHDGETERFAADVVVVSCGAANSAQAAARVGERQAPERARERLRPGRAQLHVPREPGRARALARGEPDRLPEDARAQRLLLRRRRTSTTRSGTSRWSASRRRRCSEARSRRRRSSRRDWTLERIARHAIDFWLSTEDLPLPENRVTVDGDGKLTLAYKPTNDEPKKRLLAQAQVDARQARHEPRAT